MRFDPIQIHQRDYILQPVCNMLEGVRLALFGYGGRNEANLPKKQQLSPIHSH